MNRIFKKTYIVIGDFKVLKKINGGSFGDIYLGQSIVTGENVAIKVESIYSISPQLEFENNAYNLIGPGVGIPKVYYFTKYENTYMLVMELLGPSLEEFFNYCQRQFTMKTILMLGEQMVSRCELIHEHGVIHRDIKPDNFLMGRNGGFRTVYLIDFGLGKKFYDKITKVHIPYREGISLTGTARYATITAHLGAEQSRRDDLQSVGYVLMYFYLGRLPWQGIQGSTRKQRQELICERKISISVESLCKGAPYHFVEYLRYCLALRFTERPNYDLLRKLFRSAMSVLRLKPDLMFDWVMIKVNAEYNTKKFPNEVIHIKTACEDLEEKNKKNLKSLLI